ncbi:hypothetical protein GX48_07234 [Paracoccidioides brasiliensis]|nr:hypothetical protein GX48_07234 [Paracoccidioides brasiliensis]
MAHIDNRVIHIDSDKDETIERTLKMIENPSTTVFTDASVNKLGHGIGIKEHWTVLTADLIAIYYALFLAWQSQLGATSLKVTRVEPLQHRTYIIISDSRSALENIKNSSKQSGQQIVYSILDTTKTDERNTASQHLNAMGAGPLWYLRK